MSFKIKPYILLIIPIFLFLFTSSCIGYKVKVNDEFPKSENQQNNKIALVSINIEKKDKDWFVNISNSNLFHGKRDDDRMQRNKPHKNDLLCVITDTDLLPLDSIIIFQPLNPRFEYPLEDGSIGSYITEIDRNDVMLRFLYNVNMKYLMIYLCESENELRLLEQLELDL